MDCLAVVLDCKTFLLKGMGRCLNLWEVPFAKKRKPQENAPGTSVHKLILRRLRYVL